MKRFLKTPGMAVLWNLLLAYLLMMATRLIFFACNWSLYDGFLTREMIWPMLHGSLVFDTSALAYLASAYIVLTLFPLHFKERSGWYKAARWFFIVPVMLGLVMNLIDCAYYPFSGNRLTMKVFDEFENDSNIGQVFFTEVVHSWYLTVAGVVSLLVLIFFTRNPEPYVKKPMRYYPVRVPVFLLAATLSVGGMRGGFSSSHPISMNNANQYVNRPVEAIGVLNTPFCFMRTLGNNPLANPHYFTDEELKNIYTAVVEPDTCQASAPGMNVVVMILESFGAEYVGSLNGGLPGYTPFLDSLISQSLTFTRSFANGRKSIDAMPSILSSLPMLGEDLFLSDASMNDITGIAEELKNCGYSTAFFHGAENGSMGFQSYSRTTGYDDYFGMTEYCADASYGGKRDYDGMWAIWDEEFLQFMADRLGEMREPFCASVFTASSHHPFKLPERYVSVWPEEGGHPIHKCIRYTDNALKLFFEKASAQPWFENTLFVLTADHTNHATDPLFQTDWGAFRVPVIFFDPSGRMPRGMRDRIAQQVDIMPTVLGWLGYDRPVVAFGENLLSESDTLGRAFNFSNGVYQYILGDSLLQFDGEAVTALYDLRLDPYQRGDLKDREPAVAARLARQLKAVIQQYMARMAENRLTIAE